MSPFPPPTRGFMSRDLVGRLKGSLQQRIGPATMAGTQARRLRCGVARLSVQEGVKVVKSMLQPTAATAERLYAPGSSHTTVSAASNRACATAW